MKFTTTILSSIALLSSTSFAALKPRNFTPREVFPRQSCPSGYKVCGSGCILTSWTCCPDRLGGCEPGYDCEMGDNGEYGCCEEGEICTGDGGVYTSDLSFTPTSTRIATTSTRYATTTRAAATDDEVLEWDTFTIVLTVTGVTTLTETVSNALYTGGIVPNSEELEWTTFYTDGETYTLASYDTTYTWESLLDSLPTTDDDFASTTRSSTSSRTTATTRSTSSASVPSASVTESFQSATSHISTVPAIWLKVSAAFAALAFGAMIVL